MKFIFYIARRYLFSKKSKNVINIISLISVIGVAVGTFALIIVLSAFNGLEQLVEDLYGAFDPDIKILPAKGKSFPKDSINFQELQQIEGIRNISAVFEETALIQFKDKQTIATLKGVDSNYIHVSGVDSMISEGNFVLKSNGLYFLVVGNGIAYNLSLYVSNNIEPLTIYAPQRAKKISLNPEKAFKKAKLLASGVFSISPEFDFKYVIGDLSYIQTLFNARNRLSSIEISLSKPQKTKAVKKALQKLLGQNFTVKTRYELNEMVFKTNNTEKWITYLILSFILIIATFNVIGSLTMLILEKKRDIKVLKSLGADLQTIMNIFLTEGMLITLIGGITGLVAGLALCFIHIKYGLIRLSGTIVEFYPVKILWSDVLLVAATVFIIGWTTSYLPSRWVVKKAYQ